MTPKQEENIADDQVQEKILPMTKPLYQRQNLGYIYNVGHLQKLNLWSGGLAIF